MLGQVRTESCEIQQIDMPWQNLQYCPAQRRVKDIKVEQYWRNIISESVAVTIPRFVYDILSGKQEWDNAAN